VCSLLKAPAPASFYEVALTQTLARWQPDCIIPILVADLQRGWLLMPDGGPRLRDLIRADGDVRQWEVGLPRYGILQQDLVSRREELLSLGVPDRRLSVLAASFEQLLTDERALRIDREDGLSRDEVHRLREAIPLIAAAVEQLAAFGIPESLHHGDFHDGNVFARAGSYLIFDWGDASISHPFFSVRTVIVSVERTLGLDEGQAPEELLRDAYLEPWTAFASRQDLLAAFELARRLWMIPSALGWHQIVARLEGEEREAFAYTVVWLLKEFLDADALGRGMAR
jgi:Phosphotransferase enzyme family